MDAQELVQRLVRGSANINRMREEISNVIDMVLGFANKVIPFYIVNLTDGDIDWEARIRFNNLIQIQCWSRAEAKLIYSSVPGAVTLRMENVMKVHQALPAFVDGMAKTVPGLAEKWQPLLDAAEV